MVPFGFSKPKNVSIGHFGDLTFLYKFQTRAVEQKKQPISGKLCVCCDDFFVLKNSQKRLLGLKNHNFWSVKA